MRKQGNGRRMLIGKKRRDERRRTRERRQRWRRWKAGIRKEVIEGKTNAVKTKEKC